MGRLAEAKAVIWCWALALAMVFIAASCGVVHAADIDIEKLANAIYKAEGGARTKHPYGILAKYKTTTPRQACINTIKSNLKRWNGQGDFIDALGKVYCPIGASNDPKGLNKNWTRNVKHFYNNQ